jgi:peptidoglycan hydrolase-like protein with peptidoglycan-binding domain
MGDSTEALAPQWFIRELEPGFIGVDVEVIQRKFGLPVTGVFDNELWKYVKGLQTKRGLPVTGVVDDALARILGDKADEGLPPVWFTRDLALWDEGPDVLALREALNLANGDDRFDPDVEAAVRRHQSATQVEPTGRVDAAFTISLR